MGQNVFAPSIFFIAFRESLEAALVVGTLLGMLESLARDILPDSPASNSTTPASSADDKSPSTSAGSSSSSSDVEVAHNRTNERRVLIRKLRKTVLLGAAGGILLAICIGAAFLAVFYTQSNDLYGKAEELWEGIFCLIASPLVTVMALAILRADQSKTKWRKKLQKAFAGKLQAQDVDNDAISPLVNAAETNDGQQAAIADGEQIAQEDQNKKSVGTPDDEHNAVPDLKKTSSTPSNQSTPSSPSQKAPFGRRIVDTLKMPFEKHNRGTTVLFTIPFVTTLREGLEAVVFLGGVSLGLEASSIPLAAIVGLFCGFLCGFIVFRAGGYGKIKIFLLFSTCLLLLIAAGLFSRSIYYLQFYGYVKKVGDAAAEGGDGPGSFDALNYIWHINYANPENKSSSWGLLNAITGWNNTGTAGSIGSYVAYWIAVIAYLVYAMYTEQRLPCVKRKQKTSVN